MQPAAITLAEFASTLRFDRLPPEVVERATQCIADTIGVALLGSRLPWGRMVASYAQRYGTGGTSRLIGHDARVSAPMAALANGVFAHAFELDNLREPGAGVHAGAALVPAGLAIAEEIGASGEDLLTAIVAGVEVMFRIGAASRHSSETLGFHAPGITGPFGAAITAGHLLGLDAQQLANALGIAGSLGGGVLAFAHAQHGAMVKRLHLGRASESGVLAARLAAEGYEGPETILDGRFGFLETYCREGDPARLTADLGSAWETMRICIKRYACHVTAHTPVQSVLELRAEHGFDARDVKRMIVRASAKVLSHHANGDPADVAAAQYSVPFCAAMALFEEPVSPEVFERALANDALKTLARAAHIESLPSAPPWASEIAIELRDGRAFRRTSSVFKGMPEAPLTADELAAKFVRCAEGFPQSHELLAGLLRLESIADVRTLPVQARPGMGG